MANPFCKPPPEGIATRFAVGHERPVRIELKYALECQELIMGKMRKAKDNAKQLALLTRALSQIQESIRIARNRPLPGQFRPELPKGKAVRVSGPVIDLLPGIPPGAFVETPNPKPAETNGKKESLLAEGRGDHGGRGEGTKEETRTDEDPPSDGNGRPGILPSGENGSGGGSGVSYPGVSGG